MRKPNWFDTSSIFCAALLALSSPSWADECESFAEAIQHYDEMRRQAHEASIEASRAAYLGEFDSSKSYTADELEMLLFGEDSQTRLRTAFDIAYETALPVIDSASPAQAKQAAKVAYEMAVAVGPALRPKARAAAFRLIYTLACTSD